MKKIVLVMLVMTFVFLTGCNNSDQNKAGANSELAKEHKDAAKEEAHDVKKFKEEEKKNNF
jgi:uncharacterized protein YxeA